MRSRLRKVKPALPGFLSKQSLLYVASFAVIGGAIMFLISHAATNASSFEPELGAVGNGATAMQITGASGGSAVKFTAPNTSVTLPNPGTWVNVTGNLTRTGWIRIFAVPGTSKVVAGLGEDFKGVGVWSNSGGSTWSKTGGSGPADLNMTTNILFDPANPSQIWYEAGIYGDPGGIYKTTNAGATWTRLGNVGHNDSLSVDFSDPNRQTMLAGDHEFASHVYKSTNGGSTWTAIDGTIPDGHGALASPIVIDANTYIVNSENYGGSGTIYRTTNGGASWSVVSNSDGSGSKFPNVMSNGNIFFRGCDTFYATSCEGVIRSTDKGLTWKRVGLGHSFVAAPIELPDGRLVGSDGSRLKVSSDNGNTWTNFGATIPCDGYWSYVAYSSGQDAFYVGQPDCGVWRLK